MKYKLKTEHILSIVILLCIAFGFQITRDMDAFDANILYNAHMLQTETEKFLKETHGELTEELALNYDFRIYYLVKSINKISDKNIIYKKASLKNFKSLVIKMPEQKEKYEEYCKFLGEVSEELKELDFNSTKIEFMKVLSNIDEKSLKFLQKIE